MGDDNDAETRLQVILCELGDEFDTLGDEYQCCLPPIVAWCILTREKSWQGIDQDLQQHQKSIQALQAISEIIHESTTATSSSTQPRPTISVTNLHATAFSLLPLDNNKNAFAVSTCLLLCCIALQRIDYDLFLQRPKRYQSLQLDTLNGFYRQQQWACGHNTTTSAEKPSTRGVHYNRLFVDYILPATSHIQTLVVRFHWAATTPQPPPTSNYYMLFEAMSVQILAEQQLQRQNFRYYHSSCHTAIHRLIFVDHPTIDWDLLWQHCWRKHHGVQIVGNPRTSTTRSRSDGPSPHEALVRWSEDEDNDESGASSCWNFQSDWPDQGVALLMAHLWTELPCVYSPAFQWYMFFPYLDGVILQWEAEQEAVTTLDDMATRGPQNGAGVASTTLEHAFGMLASLVAQMPRHSVALFSANLENESIPDNPLRTLQLLSNHMMGAASTSLRNPGPTAPATFQMMRNLLEVYPPRVQIRLVDILLQRCPYPSLRPKLMDLLRGCATWTKEGTAAVGERAIASLLEFCNRTSIQPLLSSFSSTVLLEQETLELHLAVLGVMEKIPALQRASFHDRLGRMKHHLQQKVGKSDRAIDANTSNAWALMLLMLERMLG